MKSTLEAGTPMRAVDWVCAAVLVVGTLRALYVLAFGEAPGRAASLGRLIAVLLAVAVVQLWRWRRQRRGRRVGRDDVQW